MGQGESAVHPRDRRVSLILLGSGTIAATYFTLATSWYSMRVDDFSMVTTRSVPDAGPLGAYGWERWVLVLTLVAAASVAGVLLSNRGGRLLKLAAVALIGLAAASVALLLWRLVDQPDLVDHMTETYKGEFKVHSMQATWSFAGGFTAFLLILAGVSGLILSGQPQAGMAHPLPAAQPGPQG